MQLDLMRALRQSILQGQFPAFVQQFMDTMYPSGEFPKWVVEALSSVGIHLQSPGDGKASTQQKDRTD